MYTCSLHWDIPSCARRAPTRLATANDRGCLWLDGKGWTVAFQPETEGLIFHTIYSLLNHREIPSCHCFYHCSLVKKIVPHGHSLICHVNHHRDSSILDDRHVFVKQLDMTGNYQCHMWPEAGFH